MDCWIGVVQEGPSRTVRLAGQLTAEQVPELLAVCGQSRPLQLDLTDLSSADIAGIDVLQRLRDSGATLVGASGYLQLKIDTPSGARGHPPRASGSSGKR